MSKNIFESFQQKYELSRLAKTDFSALVVLTYILLRGTRQKGTVHPKIILCSLVERK